MQWGVLEAVRFVSPRFLMILYQITGTMASLLLFCWTYLVKNVCSVNILCIFLTTKLLFVILHSASWLLPAYMRSCCLSGSSIILERDKKMRKKIIHMTMCAVVCFAINGCIRSQVQEHAIEDTQTETFTTEIYETKSSEPRQLAENQSGDNHQRGGAGGGISEMDTDQEIISIVETGASKFQQYTFEDAESGISLEYSLFVPDDYNEEAKYPFIMYIPDSSGANKSAKEIVEQYYGADVWVTDEEQAKHQSFVLVPAYTEIAVDDNWTVSDQVDVTVRLIQELTDHYSIDTNRIYTTGQSMGCMISLYLSSQYPDLFAASIFVSGQWDISVLKGLENKKFFYITAGGDTKASGGQDEVKSMFDADGVPYSYGVWNAQDTLEEQNLAAEELIQKGFSANMIRFETGSVLKDGQGMEHMASFNYAYKISAVRDWLFTQVK